MATPSNKTPEMWADLDRISTFMFGRKTTESIQNDVCVCCGQGATEFREPLSEKEFTISGLCQDCQDRTFGTGDE